MKKQDNFNKNSKAIWQNKVNYAMTVALGDMIENFGIRRGLSREMMAKSFSVSLADFSLMLDGSVVIPSELLERMVTFFELDTDLTRVVYDFHAVANDTIPLDIRKHFESEGVKLTPQMETSLRNNPKMVQMIRNKIDYSNTTVEGKRPLTKKM